MDRVNFKYRNRILSLPGGDLPFYVEDHPSRSIGVSLYNDDAEIYGSLNLGGINYWGRPSSGIWEIPLPASITRSFIALYADYRNRNIHEAEDLDTGEYYKVTFFIAPRAETIMDDVEEAVPEVMDHPSLTGLDRDIERGFQEEEEDAVDLLDPMEEIVYRR